MLTMCELEFSLLLELVYAGFILISLYFPFSVKNRVIQSFRI